MSKKFKSWLIEVGWKMQPIPWIEHPTNALVSVNSYSWSQEGSNIKWKQVWKTCPKCKKLGKNAPTLKSKWKCDHFFFQKTRNMQQTIRFSFLFSRSCEILHIKFVAQSYNWVINQMILLLINLIHIKLGL